MMVLGALTREDDLVSLQMFPGIDCKRPQPLNLSVIKYLMANFCKKNGASNVYSMRPTLFLSGFVMNI